MNTLTWRTLVQHKGQVSGHRVNPTGPEGPVPLLLVIISENGQGALVEQAHEALQGHHRGAVAEHEHALGMVPAMRLLRISFPETNWQ